MSGLKKKINLIKNDHSHGSSILLQKIIEVFILSKYSTDEMRLAFSELRQIDTSMVVIHHFLNELEPEISRDFQAQVQQYINKWENVNYKITMNLKDYLPGNSLTILAHSHSGVIIEVVKNLMKSGYSIKVIQTESLPGGEGKIQATALRQLGLDISIIEDESIIHSMAAVDCVFLGVDQYDDDSFVNKIGSKHIVETANQFNILMFILGDTRKQVKQTKTIPGGLFEKVLIKNNVRIITERPD